VIRMSTAPRREIKRSPTPWRGHLESWKRRRRAECGDDRRTGPVEGLPSSPALTSSPLIVVSATTKRGVITRLQKEKSDDRKK